MKRESMAPSWELLLTSLGQFEHRCNAKVTKKLFLIGLLTINTFSRFFPNKMIPQHVACMILTHLPMIHMRPWSDHIARHRAQPRWPLLLATNSRLRHLALAAMKASGIGRSRIQGRWKKVLFHQQVGSGSRIFQEAGQQRQNCNQDAKYLVPLSCKLSSLNTANNSQQVRPNCLQNQKCRMKTYENIRSSSVFSQQLHTCYALALPCKQAFSAILPWNKHIFESLVWAKEPHDLSSSGGHLTQQISTRHSDTFDMIHFDLWWPIHVFCS